MLRDARPPSRLRARAVRLFAADPQPARQLVTGIGAAISRTLAAAVAAVTVVGRRREPLDAVAETIGAAVAVAGRIVTIPSTAGFKGYPYVAAYVAAKHGAIGLTRARATSRHGARPNSPRRTARSISMVSAALLAKLAAGGDAPGFTGRLTQVLTDFETARAAAWRERLA